MKKKIVAAVILLLIAIQFIPVDKENPRSVAELDFFEINTPSNELHVLVKKACYDCHSNQTEYPWYASVAPVSFVVAHHIEEGREHLNFSDWGTYSEREQDHKLEECIEEIEEDEMPLKAYTWLHSSANLNSEDKEKLISFFKSLQ
ncbi:MAG: heme-binding domain-containing protein [Cyclobacteriaceae bacterium]